MRSSVRWCALLAATLVVGLVVSAGAQATDPLVGTWTLDVAKSTYKPGPMPKSATVVIEAAGAKGIKVSVDAVGGDGKPVKWGYTSMRDGKDAPVTGSPMFDMASVEQTSPTTGTITYKKDGKTVVTSKTQLSSDGKTLTVTSDGTTADGKPMHNVGVYHRK